MTAAAQPETIGESQKYWTHGVETFPSPVAQFRMAQLIDMDDRLYETARVVYRFMVGWYHEGYGDALLSQRHVAKVMKQRAPAGGVVPSRNAVQRAIIALMDTGWVVRSFQGRGKGKGASRYVPVMNVLELAAQGKFPEPAHFTGPVEPAHANGPVVAHANGPVEGEPAHFTGPKTLLPDSAGEPKTGKEDMDFAPPASALTGVAAAKEGYDELFDAYGVRKEFAAGKVEYEKLAPSPDLHAEIVLAAKAWRAAAGDIERMHLARWLREQRFREEPKERKAKVAEPLAACVPEPANDNAADGMPYRRETLEIIRAHIDEDREYDEGVWVKYMNLEYRRLEDGNEEDGDSFIVASNRPELQEEGQREFQQHLARAGLDLPIKPEDLVGKAFVRTLPAKFASWVYEPAPPQVSKQPRLPEGYVRPWDRPRVLKQVDRSAIDWSKYHHVLDDDEELKDMA